MKIQRAQIRHFRNLVDVELHPHVETNWFLGQNGQGKTNILESLYVGCRGRSFRPYSSKNDWLPQKVAGQPHLFMEIVDSRKFSIEVTFALNEGGSWESGLNGKRIPIAKTRSLIPIVAFSPDDHALIRWEPEIRRHFLDDMMSDVGPGYIEALNRYQEALKSRNKVLKNLDFTQQGMNAELMAWSETLTDCAIELCQMRREMWPSFVKYFLEVSRELFLGSGIQIDLKMMEDYSGPLKSEDFLEFLLKDLAKDQVTKWTHRGPHRDDFQVLLNGADSKSVASQGQARMIALALKWAHGQWVMEERGELPIFLVDDFSSEFDAERRQSLLSFLKGTKGQVFLTGTERSLVDSGAFSDYNLYTVCRGAVQAERPFGELNV